jgi:hypothetical protein
MKVTWNELLGGALTCAIFGYILALRLHNKYPKISTLEFGVALSAFSMLNTGPHAGMLADYRKYGFLFNIVVLVVLFLFEFG